ncbi:YhdP family protein [Achromobacter piechaudii]|uniref:TIGR02099 family protein n=1 Tax=Achromobacter piechaudii ATCC 43553 TaxID=742159 RepID=D4XAH9_9BURK|nr:YhdP family protein [Achromobacter piechaudii]EFF76152.1 TIGR02099 family protein [Achromobacter piechaudii ATCC 43553]
MLRCLFWAALIVYGVVAVGFLGVRYWVLPRVGEWRPQIEAYASDALGARVTIGDIKANWQGLNPRLDLTSVQVVDDSETPVLSLPSVSAVLAWRSVLTLSPRLVRLQLHKPELTLRRDPANHLWVAGQDIDLNASDHRSDLNHPALRWLARQRELSVDDATIIWQDDLRRAPALPLTGVDFLMRNGSLSHRFVLRASAGDALARKVELRGEFNRSLFAANSSNPANWSGQFYTELDDVEPQAWAPWIPAPGISGRIAARAWLQLERGKFTELTSDVALRGVDWAADHDGPSVRGASAQFRLQGLPGDFVQIEDVPLARSPGAPDVSVKGAAQHLRVTLPGVFKEPTLVAHELSVDAQVKGPDAKNWFVDVAKFHVVNDDLDVRLQGQWKREGKTVAGSVDMRGTMVRGAMPAIHRYLPLEVNADAREWLEVGLPAGEMRSASITLKGDLDDFPYAAPNATGEFVIAGAYAGAKVDYAPPAERRKGWPVLENLSGNFRIDKVSLTLDSAGGAIARTGPGDVVNLGVVTATIPDMDHGAELSLDGETSGPVSAYLAMAANSPLGGLLDGALDEARGTGDWRVPLKLKVPLLNTDDTQVQGHILFADNSFTFMPEMPLLKDLHGDLEFSEKGVQTKEIRAQFLGGPVKLFGTLAQSSDVLQFEGSLTGAGLAQLSNTPSMSRFSGKTAYKGRLGYQKGGSVEISMESNLAGMAIDMPAPVGKAASSSQLLKLQWGGAQDRDAKDRRWLTASLGENVNALFERDPGDATPSYFARGAFGIGRPATLPERGLSLNASLPELDMDGWETVVDGFDAPAGKGAARKSAPKPVFPPPERISLATGLLRASGYTLNDLTLYAMRPGPSQWRVDIQSRQATGSLEWQEASGAIAGQIKARMKHLSFGGEGDTNEADKALASGNDLSDIPAIDLQAKEFFLYGKNVGELQVVGTNLERGRQWRLDKLTITNDAANLNATGNWRLEGPDRGLSVDANANFTDLGKFLARIGFENVVSGGSGTAQGRATWRNLPWTHNVADVSGEVDISLDKGRFMHVNSRTARLLELLSLQSLQRLARLDVNPTNLLRDGFPFDTIRGRVKMADGKMTTEGYKINGPVAAIVLAGGVNIISERWDLKAVVIPNLDASGAAMVTALAVNPLIGLGAFVTQWLLKQPLARAMTMEYSVTGNWDDPQIEPIDASSKSADKSGDKQTPRPANAPARGALPEFIEH